jgi:hypothetical protein
MTEQLDLLGYRPRNVSLQRCRCLTTDEGFRRWLESAEGRRISGEFVRLARMLKDSGHRHFGAKALCEYIRFNIALKEGPDGFKLNNNVTSRLSRWAMQSNEDLRGFFETRSLTANGRE